MPTYIAFLRAINIGKRQFRKAAIVAACESAGCTDVETYINTGNLHVTSRMRSRSKVEEALEKAFLEDRGFEVPTIAFTPSEITAIAGEATEFAKDHDGVHYVSLLKDEPTAELIGKIEAAGQGAESARVGGRAVHLMLGANYHEAKLSNSTVEKVMGVATNRNLKVIRTVAEKWGE